MNTQAIDNTSIKNNTNCNESEDKNITQITQGQGTPQAKSALAQSSTTTITTPLLEHHSITTETPLANNVVSAPFTCIDHSGQTLVKLEIDDIKDILNANPNDKFEFATKHHLKCSIYIDHKFISNCKPTEAHMLHRPVFAMSAHAQAFSQFLKMLFTNPIINTNIAQFHFDLIDQDNRNESNNYKITTCIMSEINTYQNLLTSLTSIHINKLAKDTHLCFPNISSIQFISLDEYFGRLSLGQLHESLHLQIRAFAGDHFGSSNIIKLTIIDSFKPNPNKYRRNYNANDHTLFLCNFKKLETLITKSTGSLSFEDAFDSLETIDLFENTGNEEAKLIIQNTATFPMLKTLLLRSECILELHREDPFPALETFDCPQSLEDHPAVKQIKQKIEERKTLA